MHHDKNSSELEDRSPYEFVLRNRTGEVRFRAVSLTRMGILKKILSFLSNLILTKNVEELIVHCEALDNLSFSLLCKFVLFNLNRQADERGTLLRVKGLNAQMREILKSMGLESLGKA